MARQRSLRPAKCAFGGSLAGRYSGAHARGEVAAVKIGGEVTRSCLSNQSSRDGAEESEVMKLAAKSS